MRPERKKPKQTVGILFHRDGVAVINYVNIYFGVTGRRDPEALSSNFPPDNFFFFFFALENPS